MARSRRLGLFDQQPSSRAAEWISGEPEGADAVISAAPPIAAAIIYSGLSLDGGASLG